MFLVLKACSLLGIFLLLPMMQEFSVKTCMKKNLAVSQTGLFCYLNENL